MGRLGNMLFQIAGTIGIATAVREKFAFPPYQNNQHKNTFDSTEDIDLKKYFKNPLPLLDERLEFVTQEIPWGFFNMQLPEGNVDIVGYLQSEKYFKHAESIVRHFFELKLPSLYICHKMIPDNAVCVHVRIGDYAHLQDYHPLQTKDYYTRALAELPADHGEIFVFSDEPDKAELLFDVPITIVRGNHYMTDFYLMTQCTHFIIANSSFSWWGAWLSTMPGKTVVAPKNWFGPAAGISAEDIYCEGWKVV